MSENLCYTDAYARSTNGVVVDVDAEANAVLLDRTVFYPGGGGQPADRGTLTGASGGSWPVTTATKRGADVWHTIDGVLPGVDTQVSAEIDWDRRHALMRTHSALHILCGVIWRDHGASVTGGNMEPLEARMDFEFDPLPEGFVARVQELVNAEIAADRPIQIEFLPRDTALEDADLIRTKVSLIPESVKEIRVVDIVGLDKQADGGTHVRSTKEIGRFEVVKTESKGKGNKRLRIRIHDA